MTVNCVPPRTAASRRARNPGRTGPKRSCGRGCAMPEEKKTTSVQILCIEKTIAIVKRSIWNSDWDTFFRWTDPPKNEFNQSCIESGTRYIRGFDAIWLIHQQHQPARPHSSFLIRLYLNRRPYFANLSDEISSHVAKRTYDIPNRSIDQSVVDIHVYCGIIMWWWFYYFIFLYKSKCKDHVLSWSVIYDRNKQLVIPIPCIGSVIYTREI